MIPLFTLLSSNKHSIDQFSFVAGMVGLLATLTAFVGNIAVVVVSEGPDLIDTTISDLAAGKHAWILDFSLYILCLGMLTVAVALYQRGFDSWDWKLGCITLGSVSLIIFGIAFYEEYGDGIPGGLVIHPYLVRALWLTFGSSALLMTRGLYQIHNTWGRISAGLGVIWVVAAPLFILIPDAWNGLYERAIGALILGWLILVSIYLIRSAKD